MKIQARFIWAEKPVVRICAHGNEQCYYRHVEALVPGCLHGSNSYKTLGITFWLHIPQFQLRIMYMNDFPVMAANGPKHVANNTVNQYSKCIYNFTNDCTIISNKTYVQSNKIHKVFFNEWVYSSRMLARHVSDLTGPSSGTKRMHGPGLKPIRQGLIQSSGVEAWCVVHYHCNPGLGNYE